MSVPLDWQAGFISVSVLLGEPLDVALARLPTPISAGANLLAAELGASDRGTRARALARTATELLVSLDAAELA
jgi:hypothetical protein